jgi:3alpha(or 20beta)-hydroxysteroid dehydrogenase
VRPCQEPSDHIRRAMDPLHMTEDRTTRASLTDRTVVVTGAARGLGVAIADACISHGATVIITDIRAEQLHATAEALGDKCSAHVLDVTDARSWQDLVAVLRAGIGRPDVLVNNAGIVSSASIADTTLADLQLAFDVNVAGTFLGIKAYIELHEELAQPRPGSIVNIASVRSLIGGARASTYCATKFGVRGLTKSAAVELGPLGIRVNSVCPGPIESEMSSGNPEFAHMDWDSYVARLPLGRFGQPIDVGEAVAWLGSDASLFVTGIDLPVDGGLTATSYSVEPRT